MHVNSSILPVVTGTADIGSSTLRFNRIYSETYRVHSNILPDANLGAAIGADLSRFSIGYISRWTIAAAGISPNSANNGNIGADALPVNYCFARYYRVGTTVYPAVNGGANIGTSLRRFNDFYISGTTYDTSDLRLKENVIDCPVGLDYILATRAVQYQWKKADHRRLNWGIIAQEQLAITGEGHALVWHDEENDSYNYTSYNFIGPLVNSIQELNEHDETLKSRVDVLEEHVGPAKDGATLEERVTALEAETASIKSRLAALEAHHA